MTVGPSQSSRQLGFISSLQSSANQLYCTLFSSESATSLASLTQTPKFTMDEPVMDPPFGSPEPSGSLHCEESGEDPVDDAQDNQPTETVDSAFTDASLDPPFYSSHTQRPSRKRSLDIAVENDPFHDCFGAPPNPNNTPTSNSEQTSNSSSEAGSCRAQDSQAASAPKADYHCFSCLDGSQDMYDAHKDKEDVKVHRRRMQPRESSIANLVFGTVSPSPDTMDSPADELNDATPPRLRSPQFSPPSSFFGPPRIHFRTQDSRDWKYEHPATDGPKFPARKPRHRRRHIQRPFPYRVPTRTSIPKADTDRSPIPFPSALNLPFRRERHAHRELGTSGNQNGDIKKVKDFLLGCRVWQWLRECAMIRLSLHKSLPSSEHHSYLLYLRVSRSTFSVNFSYAAKPDKRTLPPVLSSPADGATMVLFQVSFFVPVAALSAIQMTSSGVRATLGSKVVRVVVSAAAGGLMDVISGLVLFALRVLEWMRGFGGGS